MNLSKLFISVVAAGCLLQTGAAAAQDAAAPPAVQAQWQEHELSFHFMGFRTYYNCYSLEDRLEQMLRDLGARPDVQVIATGCAPRQVSSMISTRIRLSMPVDAASGSAGEVFAAQRKTVTLPVHSGSRVGTGECELLEQVRRQLLPALKLEVVKDDLRCFPGAESLGNRTMQVAALVPVQSAAGR